MKNQNIFFFLLALSMLITGLSYATTDGMIPEPARPMPYTDFLTIDATNGTSRATITTAVQIATGGYVVINNEGAGVLRMKNATSTDVLEDGFGIAAGGVYGIRLWGNQALWVECSTTADISVIRGN